jgi:hypothetical protein
MLLPKLLADIRLFKEVRNIIEGKVKALKELRERARTPWTPTSEEEWAKVRDIRIPRNYFGIVRTASNNYVHAGYGVLLEMPVIDEKSPRLDLPVSDVVIMMSPTTVALGTDEFMRAFSDTIVSAREHALEETLRRGIHGRKA